MKYILFIILFLIKPILAQEVSYLARSPRALLMGDAFTAIADDEYTLFYNPAALGRNKGVSLTVLDPSFGLTDALSELDRFNNLPSTAPGIANRLMDFPIHTQVGVFPTMKMGPIGFTLFANNSTNFLLRNATNPMLDINYRYDRGFVVGYGYNIIGNGAFTTKASRKGSKSEVSAGRRLSLGASIKHMNRQGINNKFDLFGTTILSSINSGAGNISSIKDSLGYSAGSAWGYDLGAEYSQSSGHSTFTAGLAILDLASTRFTKTSGTAEVPKQDMIINSGMAFKQDFGLLDYTLSADLSPLNGMVGWERKFHIGAELSLPLITLNAGLSEGYVSYGGSIKLWPFKLTAGFYGKEVGSTYREQEAKRIILYLSLFDFSIDL